MLKENVVEVEEGEVLKSAKAHEDEQSRDHEPQEVPIAKRNRKRFRQQLTCAAKLPFDRCRTVRNDKHCHEHRCDENHDDRCHRRAPPEMREQQARADCAARDTDEVGYAVVAGRRATLLDGHHIRKQPLIRSLRRVGRELQQEVARDQPPVVARERDSGQEEHVAGRAGDDEGTPASPRSDGAVRNASDCRLPQDRHQRPE